MTLKDVEDAQKALIDVVGDRRGGRRVDTERVGRLSRALGLEPEAPVRSILEALIARFGEEPAGLGKYATDLWRCLVVQKESFSTTAEALGDARGRSTRSAYSDLVAGPIARQLMSARERRAAVRCAVPKTDLEEVLGRSEEESSRRRGPGMMFLLDDARWALQSYPGEADPLCVGDQVFPCTVIASADEFARLDEVVIDLRSSQRFTLPEEVAAHSDLAFMTFERYLAHNDAELFDGDLARLSGMERTGNRLSLTIDKVGYYDVVRTSIAIDYADADADTVRGRFLVDEGGQLAPLQDSIAANAIGIDGLLLSADRKIILPVRSDKVALSSGQIGVSFSGDMDYRDLYDRTRLSSEVLFRELQEELGVRADEITANRWWVVGLTRDLVRGGKPHIHLFAQTHLTADEIHRRWEDAQHKSEGEGEWCDVLIPDVVDPTRRWQPENAAQLHRWLNRVISQHGRRFSVRAGTTFGLWIKAMTERDLDQGRRALES